MKIMELLTKLDNTSTDDTDRILLNGGGWTELYKYFKQRSRTDRKHVQADAPYSYDKELWQAIEEVMYEKA